MQALNKIIHEKDINTIFVDIDDTLYDYEYAHSQSIKHCYKCFIDLYKGKSFISFYKEYRSCRSNITAKFNNNGSARSRILALQILFEKYNIDQAYIHAYNFENLYWKKLYTFIKPNKNLIKALKTYKRSGLKICAVSDMHMRIQVEKLKVLKLEHVIDFLVTSEEVGIEKPNKKIFRHALNKLSAKPNKTLMIGDNMKKDIKGAEAMGINCFYHKFQLNNV